MQDLLYSLDYICQSDTMKVLFREDRDMIETEGELLELFDGLDEAGQLMALEAARKIKNGEEV